LVFQAHDDADAVAAVFWNGEKVTRKLVAQYGPVLVNERLKRSKVIALDRRVKSVAKRDINCRHDDPPVVVEKS
jgi:hypothetical protein